MNPYPVVWEPHSSIVKYIDTICPGTIKETIYYTPRMKEFEEHEELGKKTLFELKNGMNIFLDTTTFVPGRTRWYGSTLGIWPRNNTFSFDIPLQTHYEDDRDQNVLLPWLIHQQTPKGDDKLSNFIKTVFLEWSEIFAAFGNLDIRNLAVEVFYESIKAKSGTPDDNAAKYSLDFHCYTNGMMFGVKETIFTFNWSHDGTIMFQTLPIFLNTDEQKTASLHTIQARIAKDLGIKIPDKKLNLHDIEHRIENIILRHL